MSGVLRAVGDSVMRFNLVAAADVALVAFVIYQLWRMLEGTRGRQLTQGVFVLIVVYLVSSPFPVLNHLLKTAMQPAVIALVILFQPELRSALEQIGRIRTVRPRPGSDVLQIIFEAVDHLSSNRVGALIAIEGTTGLSDVADTGTELDAQLSVELLSAIFFPNSALHDGGVIVRHNRIVAAAAYFPPTSNPAVPRTLGMRHRAALGLAELSDAAVLVVSEETGDVSLAVSGAIERGLRRAELRDRVRHLYSGDDGAGSLGWRRRSQ